MTGGNVGTGRVSGKLKFRGSGVGVACGDREWKEQGPELAGPRITILAGLWITSAMRHLSTLSLHVSTALCHPKWQASWH